MLPLLDALFPPRCAACGRGSWPFCAACEASLHPLTGAVCRTCGLPDPMEPERCAWCPQDLDAVRAAFAYEGAVRDAVLRLKFSGILQVVEALAGPMAEAIGPASATPGAARAFDAVTWVPLGPRRMRERGFDQARLLARAIGRRTGSRAVGLLRRVRETDPQARRGADERRVAMEGAFDPMAPAPARVVLVDDVLTTGATAGACAEALRRGGARRVTLLVAARAVPRTYNRAGPASGSVVARRTSLR